jgi:hypothetical protein
MGLHYNDQPIHAVDCNNPVVHVITLYGHADFFCVLNYKVCSIEVWTVKIKACDSFV